MPHDDVMRSIELIGKDVIPASHEVKPKPYEQCVSCHLLGDSQRGIGVNEGS